MLVCSVTVLLRRTYAVELVGAAVVAPLGALGIG